MNGGGTVDVALWPSGIFHGWPGFTRLRCRRDSRDGQWQTQTRNGLRFPPSQGVRDQMGESDRVTITVTEGRGAREQGSRSYGNGRDAESPDFGWTRQRVRQREEESLPAVPGQVTGWNGEQSGRWSSGR